MLLFKTSLKILLLVSTFLLLFSTTVFANDVDDIKYVYYEDVGSIVTRVIVVNYQDALEQTDLYDEVADGVYKALMNNKKVWLETDNAVIDYSKAINDNKTYADVIDDGEYYTGRPEPDYERYYDDDDERVARRDPMVDEPDEVKDDDYPNWLVVLDDEDKDVKFKYHLETWEPISKHLFVEIEIDREVFAKEVSSFNIHAVKIAGWEATRKEDEPSRWFVGIPVDELEDVDVGDMPKDDVFELKPGKIEVRAGISWY